MEGERGGGREVSMVYVVTGGCGFLGSHLVQLLLEAEPDLGELRVFDLRPDPDLIPPAHASRVRLLHGDVTDAVAMGQALDGAHVVLHCAALVDVWGRVSPEAIARVNVQGTRTVIAACRAQGVRCLIYTSSMEVVGPNTRGDPFLRGHEDSPYPTRHTEPYSRSKAQAERLVLEANGSRVSGACLWGSIGLYGALWVSMGLYGGLWVSMGLYGSLWVSMRSLWGSMGLYGSLWVSMCLYVSLWGSMGLYGVSMCLYGSLCVSMVSVSLWVSMCLYVSLCVSMCLYVSLWSLWSLCVSMVSMCLYVSLCVSMCLYVSLCVSMCLYGLYGLHGLYVSMGQVRGGRSAGDSRSPPHWDLWGASPPAGAAVPEGLFCWGTTVLLPTGES
uniref:Uncharacterized protein n=1 Tax=Melopsittacus undulatus TaxID=13146 RepID=A0A8V5GJ04_MELUD